MFNIVLFEPEIPPNTGNIIRLCVNTSSILHLIKPLGFNLEEKKVRRAGLDYNDFADINIYDSFEDCYKKLQKNRFFAVSTKASKFYTNLKYKEGDVFVFGPETRGLPKNILNLESNEEKIRVPMTKNNRSLNLSNTVAIVLYEAWRQTNFKKGI
ncbi:MAG: tRNA (uridine(34)/cytosine(34)/5-carboxymethylaminomethyluridine(34)-2'-O)-methyltransferase TrmL [Nitrosomonadales bacterium]|nr:tRNA (uridine(34)/cytosine(34)/5-carboxymethylaminomethyluridine(34)-2'-O)-methyltransferase TrmL [Nitrosomonadales bacterium]|tara:strand:- start:133 stop:597 length:465 start_codon:yes stop_codon:yes gene_type:complete